MVFFPLKYYLRRHKLLCCVLLILLSNFLLGCCWFNPYYSADDVEERLITREPVQDYPDAAWASRNACLRAYNSMYGEY